MTPKKAKATGEPAVEAVVENPTWAISETELIKQRESEKVRQIPSQSPNRLIGMAQNRARKRGLEKAAEDAEAFNKFQAKRDRLGIKGKSTNIHPPSEESKMRASLELQLKTQRQESGQIPIAPVKGIGNRIRQNKEYRREMKIAESDAAELAELLTKPEEQIKREAARRASREAMKERIKLEARRAAKATGEFSKREAVRGAKFVGRTTRDVTKFAGRSAVKAGRAGINKLGEKRDDWVARREAKQTAKVSAAHIPEDGSSKLNEWAAGQADAISKINASQPGETEIIPAPGVIDPIAGESMPVSEPAEVIPSTTPGTIPGFSDSVAELHSMVGDDTPESIPTFSDSVSELNRMVGDNPATEPEVSTPEAAPIETIRPDAVIAPGESGDHAQPLDSQDFEVKVG